MNQSISVVIKKITNGFVVSFHDGTYTELYCSNEQQILKIVEEQTAKLRVPTK